MEFLYSKEKNVKFDILCSCPHCLMITFNKNLYDTNIDNNEDNHQDGEICESDNNDSTEKKELFILQKKDKLYKDFINLRIPSELLNNLQKNFEKATCTNKNRYCRYFELLICESLKSLKDIEINPIINEINNVSGSNLRRRSRRTRSRDLNLSRSLDFQQRLEINKKYRCIEQCFETLIVIIVTLTKWHWMNDLYNKIYRLLDQSKIYEIMGKLCNIPLLEITCNPSLYRNLFKLYKYLILYEFVQPWEKHQELSDQTHKLINSAKDFLNMVDPTAKVDLAEDGLISVSQYIVNEWDEQF